MTRIIKKGDLKRASKSLHEFTCCDCGCKFKTNEYHIDTPSHSRRMYYIVVCPYCKSELNPSVGNENEDMLEGNA